MLSEKEVSKLQKKGLVTKATSLLKKPEPIDKKLEILAGIKKSIDSIELSAEQVDTGPLYDEIKTLYKFLSITLGELKAIKSQELDITIPKHPKEWNFQITRDHQGELQSVKAIAG